MAEPPPGPLAGIRVLEFSEIIAAPFAGMMLADMGADVIKVEPPWGDPWRYIRQIVPSESRPYMAVNRGKRSLPLDLSKPEGRGIVYELLPDIDVVIANFRPGVSFKLGVDYETLSSKNPRLIYCENTAFGNEGPQSQLPGYDIIVQAITGLMTAEGHMEDGVLQHVYTPVVDVGTGIAMVSAINAALYVRERTGRGQKVEATLMATALGMHGSRFFSVEATDREAQKALLEELAVLKADGQPYEVTNALYKSSYFLPPGNIYYRTYNTKDGVLAVGCLSDTLRQRLLEVLGLSDIRFQPGYIEDSPEALAFSERLAKEAEALFSQETNEEWIAILGKAGVPAGPVRYTEELLEDEQVVANGMVVKLDHQIVGSLRMVGPLVKMSETPLQARSASPALGQHTHEILGSLGYNEERIHRLREMGITK